MVWVSKEELLKIIEEKIPEDGCEMFVHDSHDNNFVYEIESKFPVKIIQNEYLHIDLTIELGKVFL